ASCKVLGESDLAVRFPSVLASALTSLILFLWGRQVAGERTGLWAAMIFATGLQVLIHSKLAVADLLMVLMVTVAGWSVCNVVTSDKGSLALLWKVLFIVGLALGFLAKGPIAWIPLGMLLITQFRGSGRDIHRSPSSLRPKASTRQAPRPSPPGEG